MMKSSFFLRITFLIYFYIISLSLWGQTSGCLNEVNDKDEISQSLDERQTFDELMPLSVLKKSLKSLIQKNILKEDRKNKYPFSYNGFL
jgi:hypothetical protein